RLPISPDKRAFTKGPRVIPVGPHTFTMESLKSSSNKRKLDDTFPHPTTNVGDRSSASDVLRSFLVSLARAFSPTSRMSPRLLPGLLRGTSALMRHLAAHTEAVAAGEAQGAPEDAFDYLLILVEGLAAHVPAGMDARSSMSGCWSTITPATCLGLRADALLFAIASLEAALQLNLALPGVRRVVAAIERLSAQADMRGSGGGRATTSTTVHLQV
ncbi:unnamed protein product, partial [Phaeothamnion confervicola]